MQHAPDSATGAPMPAADLLATVFGRLVRWHYILAADAANVPPDVQAMMMREMMATLDELGEHPAIRAAVDARERTASPRPVDEARVARIRARAAAWSDTER